MSGFLAVAGKIGTFLLWVLFLILQTATKVVGSLLVAPSAEPQEEPRQEAAPRHRSPPAGTHPGGGPADPHEPHPQLWDPPPPPYSAPVTDAYSSSLNYRRRASAPPASEDLVVSSSGYSRSGVTAAPAHAVSAPPMLRTIKTPVSIAGNLPKLERKYSKIVDQYRSLDEVCIHGIWGCSNFQHSAVTRTFTTSSVH